jgi:FkbH-like protein
MENSLLGRIKENNEWTEKLKSLPSYKVAVLSNVVVNQIKDSLELPLRRKEINAQVHFGNYNNIVQDSLKFQSEQAVVIFWEACNLVEGLHYRSLSMEKAEIDNLIQRMKAEIQLALSNLKSVPIVIINKFSTVIFNRHFIQDNNFDFIVKELNRFLSEISEPNCLLLEIDKVIAQVGISNTFNKRFWYSSKMLYTVDFFQAYCNYLAPVFLNVLGKARKALVLDCDNTLWKGVIGEDLIDGIAISSSKKDGVYFEEVHYLAKALGQKGIILGINSKNNFEDVESVFKHKEDVGLSWNDFVITKINWTDKVANLKEIAKELNIGIDSLVQADDSDFELNFIKQELPGVDVIKVPSHLYDYPDAFREGMRYFFTLKTTSEDVERAAMYKTERMREEGKIQFGDIEDYLRSLDLEMTIHLNSEKEIVRIAQMTQKTNQFNLTTKRYAEQEIARKMVDGQHFMFSFSLKDKFGDYGITGLCIVRKEGNGNAYIDTFLMSCRIIGRNAELAFFDFLVDFLRIHEIKLLKADYIKTFKNIQVEKFYDNLNLQLESSGDEAKHYQLRIEEYKPKGINYIKINYGK